jgi:5-methyltetrahydrofolate--homocysteine methyltransferase
MGMLDQNARACLGIYLMFARDRAKAFLLDGAVGTELIARGLRVREECPEAWNLERPDDVRAVHAAYVAAGAQAVQTNSFGATRPRLRRFGREQELDAICRAAARLARDAAPGLLVLGSLGPSGETLPLASGVDVGWLEAAFTEAAAALAAGGVDAIHLETMFHPAELEAAVRGARAGAAGRPVLASMTLIPGASGLETPHGVPLARMLRAVEACAPDAVGVNCSLDAERMRPAVEALRRATDLPVMAKPQARMSEKCASRSPEAPDRFAWHARALVEAGAAAVGGCCGVGPEAIAALRRLLDGAAERAEVQP